ncbi:cupredoxin domain-containing protein [Patescibacteria group bacterium AH-259-L05]|nr:cupredoxin domain-containing protein [Patescibacteria group bacterium AH-259-L05]
MNKIILVIIVVVLIAIGGYFVLQSEPATPESAVPAPGAEDVPEMIVSPQTQQETEQLLEPEATLEPEPESTLQPELAPEPQSESPFEPVVEPQPGPEAEPEPQPQVKEFDITARRFMFEPNTITVNKGDTVKLNITSTDVTHGFAISEFGVNAILPRGGIKTVEFVASESGSYTMFCSVACGSGHFDMKGTLVVK